MANIAATTLRSDMLQKSQVHEIDLLFTADAGAFSLVSPSNAAPVVFSKDAITQSTVDALLPANDIVATTAFGSTAMGTDAFAVIVNCGGQVAELQAVIYEKGGAAPVHIIPSGSALPNTLTQGAYKTAQGDVVARIIVTDLDSATATYLIKFRVKLKTAA